MDWSIFGWVAVSGKGQSRGGGCWSGQAAMGSDNLFYDFTSEYKIDNMMTDAYQECLIAS